MKPRGELDPFGREVGDATRVVAAASTAAPVGGPARADGARSPQPLGAPRRWRWLLALLAGSAVAMAGTMWFAAGWAADLPKTIAFAIARDPFGSRSLLERGNAHAALRRVLARVGPGDTVTDLHLTDVRVWAMVRDVRDRRHSVSTGLDGEVEDSVTIGPPEGRGVPRERLAGIDLDALLPAAARRMREVRAPEAPLLSLSVDRRGRPRGWAIVFTSDVPEPQRITRIDLRGRIVE